MPDRLLHRSGAQDNPARRVAQSLSFLVGTCLCLVLALGFATSAWHKGHADEAPYAGERINPNDAPTASLMRLPGIGLSRARAIAAYRERRTEQAGQGHAFAGPNDLRRIKGIGPGVVEDIQPWLQFDEASSDDAAATAK